MVRREVVVVLRPQPASETLALGPGASASADQLASVLAAFGASMRPMFDAGAGGPPAAGGPPGVLVDAPRSPGAPPAGNLDRFHYVKVDDASAEKLVEQLRKSELVEAAYIKPPVALPLAPASRSSSSFASASAAVRARVSASHSAPIIAAKPATKIPDYTARQAYLDKAPGGVDARFAWSVLGGKGANVRIVDIEGGWRFSHVDLRMNSGGVIGGVALDSPEWTHHGTAVLGEIGGDENLFGIVGIAPEALLSAVSHTNPNDSNWGSASAIHYAATVLSPGDIMLLEMHRPGPLYNYAERDDQVGYIAVEWWPDDFAAIEFATSRGVIVVEAAGNGDQNFDDALYNTPSPDFPSFWRNPLGGALDSGAIMVGAGAPPPGTHGRDYGPDRSRLYFSNYGSRVDCQGWGEEVTSTGYGELFGAGQQLTEDYWFTDTFSGTSSASPIVAGVLASLQGIAKKRGQLVMPGAARALLRAHGTPQADGTDGPANTRRIGMRPDLRQLVSALLGVA